MELPIFTPLSSVGSFSSHNLEYFGLVRGTQFSDSDCSMDGTHDQLKHKQAQEDAFLEWGGEIRVSLDEGKAFEEQSKADQSQLKNAQHYQKNLYKHDQNDYKQANQYRAQSVLTRSFEVSPNIDLFSKEGQDYEKADQQIGNKEDIRFKNSPIPAQYPKSSVKGEMKGGSCDRDLSDGSARAEIDMYLEKTQMAAIGNHTESSGGIRKRKIESAISWHGGKMARLPIQGSQREMISSGRISSGWQAVDDLDIDLSGELASSSYNVSDALLSLPVFKQEAPSPTGPNRDPSSPPWLNRQNVMQINNMAAMNGTAGNCNTDQQSPSSGQMAPNCGNANQQGITQNAQMNLHSGGMNQQNNSHVIPYSGTQMQANSSGDQGIMDVTNGLLLCSPHGSMEGFGNCAMKPIIQSECIGTADNRFQYVLAAATSIATKCNEDTLTYLNQCQSYEIKLKKLGDLSHYRGKILKSIIRICFHERRLQFAEREQMSLWQTERPGERIVEVDVPLSYGLIHVSQPSDQPLLNTVELFWDPVKEAGVYIKVNCISTEFTAKKHGGEKGVPFRIQVETFLPGDGPPGASLAKGPPLPDRRLHAAACQIKVFKLKGADRKHKQDKEKLLRRADFERDKYQPSCECTVFTDLPIDAVFSPVGVFSGQPYSPEQCGGTLPARPSAPSSASPPRVEAPLQQLVLASPHNDLKLEQSLSRANSHGSSLNCDDEMLCRTTAQGTPASPVDSFEPNFLTEVATAAETRAWLSRNRFTPLIATFANFSGADLLRLTKEDLIQICGLADGIRLFNALHAEHAPARLTLYAKKGGDKHYSAIYLRSYRASELRRKLVTLFQDSNMKTDYHNVFMAGPNGIKVHLTDEVIQNFKNDSMFRLESLDSGILMKPAVEKTSIQNNFTI